MNILLGKILKNTKKKKSNMRLLMQTFTSSYTVNYDRSMTYRNHITCSTATFTATNMDLYHFPGLSSMIQVVNYGFCFTCYMCNRNGITTTRSPFKLSTQTFLSLKMQVY